MQKFGPSLIFGLFASLISTFLFLVLDDYIGANTILFRLSKSPLVGVFVAGALVLAFFPAILTILIKLISNIHVGIIQAKVLVNEGRLMRPTLFLVSLPIFFFSAGLLFQALLLQTYAAARELRHNQDFYRQRELVKAAGLANTGDFDGARKTYEAVIASMPSDPRNLRLLRLLDQSAKVDERSAELLERARTVQAQGRTRAYLQLVSLSVELSPESPAALEEKELADALLRDRQQQFQILFDACYLGIRAAGKEALQATDLLTSRSANYVEHLFREPDDNAKFIQDVKTELCAKSMAYASAESFFLAFLSDVGFGLLEDPE